MSHKPHAVIHTKQRIEYGTVLTVSYHNFCLY